MILGAGFSFAASRGDAPLMKNFFERLDAAEFPILDQFLTDAFGSASSANIEEALTLLEQVDASPLRSHIRAFRDWHEMAVAIRRQTLEYTHNRLQEVGWHPDSWAAALLSGHDHNTTIITTNYDVLAESILSCRHQVQHGANGTCHHCRMCALLRQGKNLPDFAKIAPTLRFGSLLKIHGSIAWRSCPNAACPQYRVIEPDTHCSPTANLVCSRCQAECEPVIIPPSMSKPIERYPQLATVWQEANRALKSAHRLMIIGFSMPATDTVFRALLRASLADNTVLREVCLIDPRTDAVLERLRTALPSRQVGISEFTAPDIHSWPDWLTAPPAAVPETPSQVRRERPVLRHRKEMTQG